MIIELQVLNGLTSGRPGVLSARACNATPSAGARWATTPTMKTATLLRWLPGLFLSSTVIGALAAQPAVSPSFALTREGNTSAFFPFFGSTVPDEYLQLHDGLPGARTITSIALRPDGSRNNTANVVSGTLMLSNAPAGVTGSAPAPTFLGNHGANRSGVMNVNLNFPAQDYRLGMPLPRPFAYTIPLPTPFQSDASGSLVWHLTVTSRFQIGSGYLDAVVGRNGAWNVAGGFGSGCKRNSTSATAALSTAMAPQWGAGTMTATLNAASMVPAQNVVFAIGVSSTAWQGMPLPLEIPGTRSAPSGACWVLASWDQLVFGAVADGTGRAMVRFAAPEPRSGTNLYTQAIGFAPNANPWNFVTSNAVHSYLAPPVTSLAPVGFLRRSGAGSITIAPNNGYVVELR